MAEVSLLTHRIAELGLSEDVEIAEMDGPWVYYVHDGSKEYPEMVVSVSGEEKVEVDPREELDEIVADWMTLEMYPFHMAVWVNGWLAFHAHPKDEDQLVAGGTTEDEVISAIEDILEERDFPMAEEGEEATNSA